MAGKRSGPARPPIDPGLNGAKQTALVARVDPLATLAAAGLSVRACDGRLLVSPPNQITPPLARLIRATRDELLKLVQERDGWERLLDWWMLAKLTTPPLAAADLSRPCRGYIPLGDRPADTATPTR